MLLKRRTHQRTAAWRRVSRHANACSWPIAALRVRFDAARLWPLLLAAELGQPISSDRPQEPWRSSGHLRVSTAPKRSSRHVWEAYPLASPRARLAPKGTRDRRRIPMLPLLASNQPRRPERRRRSLRARRPRESIRASDRSSLAPQLGSFRQFLPAAEQRVLAPVQGVAVRLLAHDRQRDGKRPEFLFRELVQVDVL
jgi:hypothetical protein